MSLRIYKIAVSVDAATAVTPTVERFFYQATATTTGADTLTIIVEDFFTDTGAAATTLPALATGNSYINVYVNGVLEMADLFAYTAGGTGVGQLVITVPVDSDILINSPIVLEVTNFVPDTSVTALT